MSDFGFRKVSAACFEVRIGDLESNTKKIIEIINKQKDSDVIVFPELSITGYTCADMFLRKEISDKALVCLKEIIDKNESDAIIGVGLPVRLESKLFNCAALIHGHELLAVIPKNNVPNYNEFYEKRWFASAKETKAQTIRLFGKDVPFGLNIIVEGSNGVKLGCEICEDLWVANAPSNTLSDLGANIIINLSASNELVTKNEYRKELVRMQSAKCNCAYVYSSSGKGESTTDVVFSGHQIIAESGSIRAEAMNMFEEDDVIVEGLVDIERIENDKIRMNSLGDISQCARTIYIENKTHEFLPERVNAYPFVPSDKDVMEKRCLEILNLQATGLATRLKKIGTKKVVIGISGGLDSTLALLVIKNAYDLLKYPYKDIVGITMPGFGTSKQTKTSADSLMELLGIDCRTIDITKACKQHLSDIGHEEDVYDIAYENTQARERTQILMDVANSENAIVVGTGDLSELALGWCTFNGDHMSMYAVNTSVPKTLVKFVISTYAEKLASEELKKVLIDICNTTISPELIPANDDGSIRQSTEDSIGKYDLHDFFLYNYVRNGFSKEKIRQLAYVAFNIDHKKIDDTLDIFVKRFRTNQFKRNALPDGPKVGSVALSPRGDWRMPSDYQG
ncbi:MAG: NAD(+) synthase [Erysipelotrichaceae bacterium]|nr:NAD(+) synthase [Erysipelotrichaceae bacterium]